MPLSKKCPNGGGRSTPCCRDTSSGLAGVASTSHGRAARSILSLDYNQRKNASRKEPAGLQGSPNVLAIRTWMERGTALFRTIFAHRARAARGGTFAAGPPPPGWLYVVWLGESKTLLKTRSMILSARLSWANAGEARSIDKASMAASIPNLLNSSFLPFT